MDLIGDVKRESMMDWVQEPWWWCPTFSFPFQSVLFASVMVSFSSRLLCGSPGAAAGLTIQEEGRLSPTSQVVDLRVDWLCRFAIRSYSWGQEYSLCQWEWRAQVGGGHRDCGTGGGSEVWHVCFQAYVHMCVRVCTYLFCNKPGCLMKAFVEIKFLRRESALDCSHKWALTASVVQDLIKIL